MDLDEKSVWFEILLMILLHAHCLSCTWPKARAVNITASDADKAPARRAVRNAPDIRNTTICCRLFQIGFSSSAAVECSGSLLRDLELHSLIITRDVQIIGLWGPWTGFPLLLSAVHNTKRLQALSTKYYRRVRKAAKSFVMSVGPSVRPYGTNFVKIQGWLKYKNNWL